MKVSTTDVDEVFVIEPDVHGDNRVWFVEWYLDNEWWKKPIYEGRYSG